MKGAMPAISVIKVGGNVLDESAALDSFLERLASIPGSRILVHGGGKIASQLGSRLGIEPNYVDGRRITDDQTIDLVTMVYGGLINKNIVSKLQSLGCNAIGLTGADGNLIPADKRPVRTVDYGWVGDVRPQEINAPLLKTLLEAGLTPVLAPLTHDGKGRMLNTNADTIASSIAVALSGFAETRLLYCFEKKGILLDVEDESSVVPKLDKALYRELKQQGRLFAGILPKIDNAFAAIDAGVKQVVIGLAEDILEDKSGTKITA